MSVTGLNHVGLSTPDLTRALAFYRDGLGFAEVVAFSWPAGTTAADAGLGVVDSSADVAVLTAGNTYLEILQFNSPAPRPAERGNDLRREGISHIGLEVRDVDAAHALALRAGATVFEERDDFAGKPVRLVRDPDGNVIELRRSDEADPLAWSRLKVRVPFADAQAPPARVPARRDSVIGVGHAAVVTDEPDTLARFYEQAGLRLADDTTYPTSRCISMHANNVVIELIQDLKDGVIPRPDGARIIDHGFNHLCFDVDHIGGIYEDLTPLGMTTHADWVAMPGGSSKMGYALDPTGTPVEWLEHLKPTSMLWPGHLNTDD